MSGKYFVDILRDVKNNEQDPEEFKFFVNSIKVLLYKSKEVSDYNIIRKMNFNNLSQRDIKELKYFLQDWELVGRDRDKIIYVNFAKSGNRKCSCDFCREEHKIDELYKISSIRFPKRQVSVRLCENCIEKLQPTGRIINDEVLYPDAITFINKCKKMTEEFRKDPIFKFSVACMNNNFKLIKDNPVLSRQFADISISFSTMLFNYFYAKKNNEIDNDFIMTLREMTRDNYNWSNERNIENIITFIPEITHLVEGVMPYIAKFKIALNFIQAYDDSYEAMKNFNSFIKTFAFNKEFYIRCQKGIGNWIYRHRIEHSIDKLKIPTEECMLALIMTIEDNPSNFELVKFTPDNVKGPKLKNYFKDYIDKLYEKIKNNKNKDDFDMLIERIFNMTEELEIEDCKTYLENNPIVENKRKKNRHRKKSSYMPS